MLRKVLLIFGLFWPPMHLRGAGFTLTDTLHIVFAAVTVLIFILEIGFGAAAFGKRFRLYSIATLLVFVVFGTLTGLDGPRIAVSHEARRLHEEGLISYNRGMMRLLSRKRLEKIACPCYQIVRAEIERLISPEGFKPI